MKKTKKSDKCQSCKAVKPLSELYSYVDGNNISITKNSPILCEKCYKLKYENK